MNPELEKLIDYAIMDGYITEAEKKVLFNKAKKMGVDEGELELILNGKLSEKKQTLEAIRPQVRKCPSCGDIMNGLSRVCPSCDYVMYSESQEKGEIVTLDKMIFQLNESLNNLKAIPKTTSPKISNNVFFTIMTGGLYFLYKKYVKQEQVFNSYGLFQDKAVEEINENARYLNNRYGDSSQI